MATKITKIQVRRDTTLNWSSVDPILSVGEIGFETDSGFQGGRMKFGDGSSPWSQLDYYGSGEKGNFNEITQNGPVDPSKDYYPQGIPALTTIDGVVVSDYAASSKGIYVGGLATYNHIFPSTNGITLGTPNQRFSDIYVESGSVHIGDNPSDEIILSHTTGATEEAQFVVDAVGPGGVVTQLTIYFDPTINAFKKGKGYYDAVGLETKIYPEGTGAPGRGLRISVTSVDADGGIESFEILDGGVGYIQTNVVSLILLPQLNIERNGRQGKVSSAIVTQQSLSEVTSQTLRLIGPNALGPVPYLSRAERALPDTNNVVNQSQFNAWTVDTANYLDQNKLQIVNVTESPELDDSGEPVYDLVVNKNAGIVANGWDNESAKEVTGGEIYKYFTGGVGWRQVGGGGTGGGTGDETDPIFRAAAAFRISETPDILNNQPKTVNFRFDGTTTIEPIMLMNNWDAIPAL